MGQYLIGLFQGISLLSAVLLGAGTLLCIVEVFVPKIGLTGFLGMVLSGAGFSSYYIDGFKLNQMIGLLAIMALAIGLFMVLELILEGKGVIKNPNRYRLRTYNNTAFNLASLVGRSAKAITNINLGGTIEIDGTLYYAISSQSIAKGCIVQVIGVQNNVLMVKF